MTTISVPEGRLLPILAGAAAGVVLATAVLFALIGAVRGGDDAGDVSAAASTSAPTDDAAGASGDDGGDGAAPAAGTGTESEAAPESPTESPDGEATTAPSGDDTTSTPTDEPAVDPGEISIQVLDAVGDGGAAAQALADELEDAGFDVIVINGASRGYDVTTVFWTEGQGPGGRAVAAAIGTDVASRTPDEVSLSDSVDVHVVVGADRG